MNILIILETGCSFAKDVIDLLVERDEINLTLFLLNKRRILNNDIFKNVLPIARCRIIEGKVLDFNQLNESLIGQDIVYSNLAGDSEKKAKNIVKAMDEKGVKKLIFLSLLGIYDIPLRPVLNPYQKVADVIKASDLDYTILRPIWVINSDEVDYAITRKSKRERGLLISQEKLAGYITKIIGLSENKNL